MGHVPHLLVPQPWPEIALPISEHTERHLTRVLRRPEGSPLTYTDGSGTRGRGTYAPGRVVRGAEDRVAAVAPEIVLAVAPPRSIDRVRFLVEKAAEFGVTEVVWLATRHGEQRAPRHDKAQAWAVGALEQSRGAWLTRVAPDLATFADLSRRGESPGSHVVAAHPGGTPVRDYLGAHADVATMAVAVGPEGGFADDEIPSGIERVGLGDRVLRVETAAIAVAAVIRLG